MKKTLLSTLSALAIFAAAGSALATPPWQNNNDDDCGCVTVEQTINVDAPQIAKASSLNILVKGASTSAQSVGGQQDIDVKNVDIDDFRSKQTINVDAVQYSKATSVNIGVKNTETSAVSVGGVQKFVGKNLD
jgi:hypothetical protein